MGSNGSTALGAADAASKNPEDPVIMRQEGKEEAAQGWLSLNSALTLGIAALSSSILTLGLSCAYWYFALRNKGPVVSEPGGEDNNGDTM